MPSRANASLLPKIPRLEKNKPPYVSMPSRANASLLRAANYGYNAGYDTACQCPHGLMPHCYFEMFIPRINVVDIVSMPSRANASLLQKAKTVKNNTTTTVSMPSRANASLLRKNNAR